MFLTKDVYYLHFISLIYYNYNEVSEIHKTTFAPFFETYVEGAYPISINMYFLNRMVHPNK